MSISDVLRHKGHDVVRMRPTDTVAAAIGRFAERSIGAVVVEDAWMRVAGIFSERDVVEAISRDGASVLDQPLEALMSTPVITCRATDRIEDVMAAMINARVRHIPVVHDGKLTGIVSIGDLVKQRLDEKALEANVLLDLSRMRA